MTKVGVLGARGRMGREVVRTVTEAPDLEVVAEVDQGDSLDALAGQMAPKRTDSVTPISGPYHQTGALGRRQR